MDTKLENVLNDLAKEFEIDAEVIDPIKKVLKKNFFLKLKDMEKITKQTWEKYDLPENLYELLMDKYNEIKGSAQPDTSSKANFPSQPQIQKEPNLLFKETIDNANQLIDLNPENLMSNINALLNKNKRTKPSEEKEPANVNKNFDYLDRVRASIPDREFAIEVFESLHKIFQNIVDNPFDSKFRKLKIGSKFYNNYIDPFKEVQLFLEHANFKSSGEFLVNDAPSEEVEKTLNDIINYAVALNFAKKSSFDPYKSYSINTIGGSTNQNNISNAFGEKGSDKSNLINLNNQNNFGSLNQYSDSNPNVPDFYKMIEIEKQRRFEEIKKSTSCDRKIKVFLKEDLEEKNKQARQEAEFDIGPGESSSLVQTFKELQRHNQEKQKWNIVSENEFEKLIKTAYFTKAIIRLRFPNDTQIQAHFASMETIGHICQLIREALENPNEEFYLFQFPPPKKFLDMNSTIYEEKLEPSTLLYVNFPNIEQGNFTYKFIKDEFIEKYKCEYILETKHHSEHKA